MRWKPTEPGPTRRTRKGSDFDFTAPKRKGLMDVFRKKIVGPVKKKRD